MKKIIFLMLWVAVVLFSGCNSSNQDESHRRIKSKDGKYSVQLPENMHELKGNGLNEAAVMQYGDLKSGISFMVIEDDVQEYKKVIDTNIEDFQMMPCFDTTKTKDIYGLKGYEFLIMQLAKGKVEDLTIETEMDEDTIINGIDARIIEYKEKIKGDKSYIILCFYKSKDKMFQVYAMTSQKKIADNKQSMLEMVKSLEIY
ncbi:MAG: hypothetical protein II937_09230 [Bacteroidales bacterium]|nr:hypothetical protein [Bacteroidales bacterium]